MPLFILVISKELIMTAVTASTLGSLNICRPYDSRIFVMSCSGAEDHDCCGIFHSACRKRSLCSTRFRATAPSKLRSDDSCGCVSPHCSNTTLSHICRVHGDFKATPGSRRAGEIQNRHLCSISGFESRPELCFGTVAEWIHAILHGICLVEFERDSTGIETCFSRKSP